MPGLSMIMDADGEFPYASGKLGEACRIGRLANGTSSGKSTVIIEMRDPDGKLHHCQTTLALLSAAVSAFHARDEMEGRPSAR